MQLNHRRRLTALLAAGTMSVGAVAAPMASAAPVVTGGLINVTIVDAVDISRVQVALPIAAAANVCNVSVLSLTTGDGTCTANADSRGNNRQ